jgi:hypothetical protein
LAKTPRRRNGPTAGLRWDFNEHAAAKLQYERQARQALLKDRKQEEHNRVARAIGTLSSATMITAEETMELLSTVRLGIHLHLLDDLPATTVNQLFIQTQAAHLQKLMGAHLDGEERNAARAKFLNASRLVVSIVPPEASAVPSGTYDVCMPSSSNTASTVAKWR